MKAYQPIDVSYFPGCSLATSAKESNQSLMEVCRYMGYRLVELNEWNCCGSSSAHSIDSELAFHLACRNLSLAPKGRPLLVACPSCILRLQQAQIRLITDRTAGIDYENRWDRPVDPNLNILHFFELMEGRLSRQTDSTLRGIKFVPYYGCMLARPPELRHKKNYHGLMEKLLTSYGAVPLTWSYSSRCCGTFLSASKPAVVEPMVNQIIQNAVDRGAECVVTACAMCHLNLEIRYTLNKKIPIFHFSEILSLAFKLPIKAGWFSRHIINPIPLLKSKGLIG